MNKREPRFLSPPSRSAIRAAVLLCSLSILACSATSNARADEATAAPSQPAPSQPALTDMSLEALMNVDVPVVYTASKVEEKATEAPSSVTVITSDDIKRYGYRTLADILESVQGFYVSYDRDYAFLGARGVNLGDFNSRILLLINGHRINNDTKDAAFIDTAFLLDVDLIDRVEIIRGPGSVLYGNNAFFGVINVITRQGKQVNNVEASGTYGSYDAYTGRVTLGHAFTNGLQFLVSGTVYHSDGPENLFYPQFNTPAQNNGVAHNLDEDGFGSFFGSVSYKDFTLEGGYIRREKGNPTAQYDTTFNDPRLVTVDDRSYVTLKYAHKFSDTLDMSADAYYDRSDFQIDYPIGLPGGPAPAPDLYEEQQSGQWAGAEVQVNKRMWNCNLFTLGGEFRDDFSQDEHEFQLEPVAGNLLNVTDQRQNIGAYVQDELTVVTNLHINAGARYDQAYDQRDRFSPTWSPRAALIYDPFEHSTFKFIYGTAFRDPSFYELGALASPSHEPRPEDITSYELIYEQGIIPGLRSSISGYYNRMDDLINIQNGSFTNFNADSLGTEMALEGKWENGIRARLSYSLQRSENRDTGGDLPDSPTHLVKFDTSVPLLPDKIFAGLEVQYTSESQTVYTDLSGDTLPGQSCPGYALVNFTLFSQNLVKNLEFSASIYNLLDTTYYEPSSRFHLQNVVQQDGRTFRIKLTYRF